MKKFKRLSSIALIGAFICSSFYGFTGVVENAFAESTTDTFTSSGTWTAPAGVTSVTAECWGGGGGGGSNGNTGGGGGGAYSEKIVSVVAGNSYTVTVGTGGGGGSSGDNPGTAGGDSWFISTGTVLAKGGSANGTGGAGGAGGAASNGVGDTKYSGGNGASGAGGGAGGGAGTAGDGGNASGHTGGSGGANDGGAGGNGAATFHDGYPGSTIGGGGGGASGSGAGGAGGARGECRLTYEPQAALSVSGGGTGATSFTVNGVLYGNGTSTIQATAAGSANQVLRIPGGGGVPSFGAIDLSQAAAVTGTLPVANGGTGITNSLTQGSIVFADVGGALSQDNSHLFWDDANNRLGVGTSTPTSELDVNGLVTAKRLKSSGVDPSISTGSCAGSGGSVSIDGTDMAGQITLDTGTAPAGSATCFTVTFTSPYASVPRVVFSPANSGAGLMGAIAAVYATSATSTFSLNSTLGLAGSTVYKWNYYVIETE
jgi:hypothetical protein